MNETEAELALEEALRAHGKSNCPNCGKKIDRGDIAWNSGETEYGTGYSVIEIQCLGCSTEIAHWHSWVNEIDNFEDLCSSLVLNDWRLDA